MFKRVENNGENEFSLPAKRPKYDIKKGSLSDTSINNKDSRNKKYGRDDIWGDDFAEEDIEEMDFIATQACLQVLYIYIYLYLYLYIYFLWLFNKWLLINLFIIFILFFRMIIL